MRIIFFSMTLLLIASAAYCTDYYVNASTGSDVAIYGTSDNPWKTITYALGQISGSGHTLHVSDGTYNTSLGEVFPINVKDGVSLIGSGMDVCIIDVDGDTNSVMRCVSIIDTSTRVEGFTITGGLLTYPADLTGSGIYISAGSNVQIVNNRITDNHTVHHPWRSSMGEGIYIENSSPKILNNMVHHNNSYLDKCKA